MDSGAAPTGRSARLATVVVVALPAIALGLLPSALHGGVAPIGSDAPVYAWWTRAAAGDGLGFLGKRPGAPALLLGLGGATRVPISALIGGLEVAGLAMLALAAAAVVRASGAGVVAIVLGGLGCAVFGTDLLGFGLVANLLAGIGVLAAIAALLGRSRRRAWLAAGLLGAGAVAHPWFCAFGIGVIVAWTLLARLLRSPDAPDPRTVARAVAGGAAAGVLGTVVALVAARHLAPPSSFDGLLREAGLRDALAAEYRQRAVEWVGRLWPWLAAAAFAVPVVRSKRGLPVLLGCWIALAVAAAVASYATGLLPAQRLLFFAFAVPILVAIAGEAIVRGSGASGSRLADVAVVLLAALALVVSVREWLGAEPSADAVDLAAAADVARIVAATPPGTPVVVVIDARSEDDAFASRALDANLVLASVPGDRVDDVVPFVGRAADAAVGRASTRAADPVFGALSARDARDVRATAADRLVVVQRGFAPGGAAGSLPGAVDALPGVVVSRPVGPIPAATSGFPPTSWAAIALAAAAILLLLGAVGLGWCRAAGVPSGSAMLLAPATGAAAVTLVAVVADRLGMPWSAPAAVAALLGGVGAAGAIVAARAAQDPAPKTFPRS